MKADTRLVQGIGIGAGLAYLFDPNAGNRRRAFIRDKLRHNSLVLLRALARSSRDLNYRMRGRLIETRSRLVTEEVPDEILVERVRSKIGRVVSHPHAVGVSASRGVVTLSGPIFRDQIDDLIHCTTEVRGVRDIIDRLEPHSPGERIPYLQGQHRIVRRPPWFNTQRVLSLVVLGSILGSEALFLRRRSMYASALGALALGVFMRGFDVPERLGGERHRRLTQARQRIKLDPFTSLRMNRPHHHRA